MASEKKKPSGPSSNTVKVKQAEAQAKQADAAAKAAEAQAKEAEARTRQIEAETEAKRLAADEKARADKMAADQSERTFGTAVSTGAYATGVVAGMAVAKGLDKKFSAGLAKKNEALDLLSKDIGRVLDKKSPLSARDGQKLRAIVATADKTRLTKVGRGSAGPTFGVGLITLGLTSRTLAAQQENETVATIMNATGSAEMVAGATVLVKDLANRASSPDLVNVRALSKVEQARAVAKAAPVAEEGASMVSKLSKVAGKLVLPVVAAGAAIVAMRSSAHAGETVTDIAASGLKAGADVVTSGAVSEFDAAKADGESNASAIARGAISTATMGVVPMIDNAIKDSGQAGLVDYMTGLYRRGAESAKAYLNDAAKQKAEAAPAAASASVRAPAPQMPKSDGQTKAYTRIVNGRAVQVASYSTPKR